METSNDTVIEPAPPRALLKLAGLCFALVLSLACALAASADEPSSLTEQLTEQKAQTPANSEKAAPPKVDLGRLLKLPDSYAKPAENRRGMGQVQWEGRFEVVRMDLHTAQIALETAQQELGEAAGDSGQWSVAAPGTNPNPENTPLSYKLRQEIRRQRESIERAERKLRDLEIEADLAEVPLEWRARHIGGQAAKPGTTTPLSTYR